MSWIQITYLEEMECPIDQHFLITVVSQIFWVENFYMFIPSTFGKTSDSWLDGGFKDTLPETNSE